MSTREEKLSAARKKLREFQEKSRSDVEPDSRRKSSASTLSPTSSCNEADNGVIHGRGSPVDLSRLSYERRETVQISESPLTNRSPPHDFNSHGVNDVVLDYGVSDTVEQFQLQIDYLQNQLTSRDQAISFLVSERNDAHTELSRVQSELQHKQDTIEDIKNKYVECSRRVGELESASPRPATSVMVTQVEEELRGAQELAGQKISHLEEQISELRCRLDGKNNECELLISEIASLRNSLSVAEIKIQQLTTDDSPATNSREIELEEENNNIKKEIDLMRRRLHAAASEGELAAHRFQQYADQCNAQQTSLRAQMKEISDECQALKADKTSLSITIENLQYDLSRVRNQESPLEERLDVLNKENVNLFQQIQEKDAAVTKLTSTLEESEATKEALLAELNTLTKRLKEIEENAVGGQANPELLAAIESDKVAASRAVAQNQILKQHLEELQQAFMRVSDEKLELTDRVLHIEHENSELRRAQGSANSLQNICVRTLRSQIEKLLKGLQVHSQNCQHDHSHHSNENNCDHHSQEQGVPEGDLENLLELVANIYVDLRQEHDSRAHDSSAHHHEHKDECQNHQDLDNSGVDHHDNQTGGGNWTQNDKELIDQLRRAVAQLQDDKALLLQRLGSPIEDPEVQGLLEVKLRRTMDEIAALDEEKQRLEHLVVQLQGETETIGEYITLYHKQRILLKQRSLEKDEQLVELSKDREELKQKLSSLNQLVSKLIAGKPVSEGNGGEVLQNTAEEIHTLITEIGKNKVVSSQGATFEQCSCCSGRLITI